MLAAARAIDPVTLSRDEYEALDEDMEMLRALLHVQTTLASIRGRRAGR